MSEILKSITKIVLLMMISTLSVVYAVAIIKAVLSGQTVFEQIPFKEVILLVAGFFFAYKGDSSKEYAGK
jgi:hypothetical protein